MVDYPEIIEQEPGVLLVADRRREDPHGKLRFWSFMFLGLAILMALVVPEFRGADGPLGLVVPAVTAAVGAVMLLMAGKPHNVLVPLASLSKIGILSVRKGASTEYPDVDREIPAEEIATVVFGMTRFPIPGRTSKVDAFSVCVHLNDGSVVPIIEASTEKGAAFKVAQGLADRLGVPVIQTGLGV